MPKALYVWQASYPWDVRTEKVCKALTKHGYETTILARYKDGQKEKEIIDGVKVIRAGYKLNRNFTQPISENPVWKNAIRQAIESFKPDIIIPREILLATACSQLAKWKNIPVIIDMAENYPAAMKDFKKYKNGFLAKLLVHRLNIPERVEKRAVLKADGIFCVCDEQVERLNFHYKYPFDKMTVVHNTPEIDFFKNSRIGSSIPPAIFGHHGFTSGDKNIEKFLKGFISATENNNKIHFIIAGDGESMADYKRIIKETNAINAVTSSGTYKIGELPSIISKFDVGVIPYQISDFNNFTIHNKLFDFFACGKPVFLAETVPFKRIIAETKAGICVDCESEAAIHRAILDFDKLDLKKMSENAFNAFKNKYNWEKDSAILIEFVKKFTN